MSEQEAVAAMLEMNFMHWTYAGRETSRLGARALGPWFIADCADGKIFALAVEEDAVAAARRARWARPTGRRRRSSRTGLARGQNMDVLKVLMDDWLGAWKVNDLYRTAQGHRIPFAPVNTMRQMYDSEHLRDRQFFVPFDQPGIGTLHLPGRAVEVQPHRRGRCADRRPASASTLTTSLAGRGPARAQPSRLDSAGPVRHSTPRRRPCPRLHRRVGRPVLHPEPRPPRRRGHPRRDDGAPPCVTRVIPPFADDEPGPGRAGYYNQYNQGKRSIVLNLHQPEAVELAYQLVAHCDVVTDNFAAGVMDRLGLGLRRSCVGSSPTSSRSSMSGYGQTGPFRRVPRVRPAGVGARRAVQPHRLPGGGPAEIGVSYPDPNAGLMGAYAVMVALLHRDLTGEGQYIDQSQWEAVLVHMAEGLLEWDMRQREPERQGNHDRLMAPHETYKTRGDDDKWVSIVVATEDEWRALTEAMGQPALATDERFASAARRKANEAALDAIITAWTSERERWEVAEALQHAGVAAFPSMSNKDLAEDPHLTERGYLVRARAPGRRRAHPRRDPVDDVGDAVRRAARRPAGRRGHRRGPRALARHGARPHRCATRRRGRVLR